MIWMDGYAKRIMQAEERARCIPAELPSSIAAAACVRTRLFNPVADLGF